jgi:hypothetical protein
VSLVCEGGVRLHTLPLVSARRFCSVISRLVIALLVLMQTQQDTWIRPHFGMTNTQLKLHLGLIVPKSGALDSTSSAGRAPRPCARMRVGNITRTWQEGKVGPCARGIATLLLHSPYSLAHPALRTTLGHFFR